LSEAGRLYRIAASGAEPSFAANALRTLGVTVEPASDAPPLPVAGPLIVAANHPTGALDGLVVGELVRRVRPDVRVLANYLLARIPELHDSCFFVDPFGGPAAAGRSRAGLRRARRWLDGGGALVAFPAGEVATDRESPWQATIGRLALTTRAPIVPVMLDGRNSRLFYAAGRLHPRLRTLLLARELLNQRNSKRRVFVGRAIDPPGPGAHVTAPAIVARARAAMEQLGIEPPVAAAALYADVAALPACARLHASGPLEVYCASADALPNVLREIGRLREITFRGAGEGTGRATDLDRFDDHYDHLFAWNQARREIVGAYRVGATDRILAAHGVAGLYTRTLFRYDRRLLDRMGPAFELGRSFVRPEYQRSYNALFLLWKGIGRLLAERPQYRVLFGAVSISSRYRDISQQLLRGFLAQNHLDGDLAPLVVPINPVRSPARGAAALADVAELDTLITRLEGSQGIPVLLRQYLKLQATLLGFNVDPDFGDALDALMMVHVDRIPRAMRARFLGELDRRAA
jgi:putative hemolysin